MRRLVSTAAIAVVSFALGALIVSARAEPSVVPERPGLDVLVELGVLEARIAAHERFIGEIATRARTQARSCRR